MNTPQLTGAKVCFVTIEFPAMVGGVGRSAERIVHYLADANAQVQVVVPQTLGKPLPTPPALAEKGVEVHWVPLDQDSPMQDLCEAVRALDDRLNFDLFQGFFLPMAYPCLLAASRGQRPVIASIRGSDAGAWLANPKALPFIQIALQRASWITSVASDLLETVAVIADMGERSSVLLNGIDTIGFPTWQPTDKNQGVVGTVARFIPKKATPLLVEAYGHLSPCLRRELVVVGGARTEVEQKEYQKVLATIQTADLEAETTITGFVKDRQTLLQHLLGFQVFVQCSHHDGLPNAVLEAAAVGVPIVATQVGGMGDVLVHGKNALLVPPRHPEALTTAISTVLSDPDLAQTLSQGGRELAQQLNLDQEKQTWLDLYGRFLGNP
jgi:glycosyltransferase involved in cell wall biosynthesis